jgi:CRP/FNR family transcriptional regulator, cyclic AMP receptor protein
MVHRCLYGQPRVSPTTHLLEYSLSRQHVQFGTDLAFQLCLNRWMAKNGQTDGSKRGTQPFDTAKFLAAAGRGRTISTHREGELFFAQGAAADAVFYIQKGKVKITVVSKQGKEAVVALLSTDEFFGEGCLIGQRLRLASAAAMTDCVTTRIEAVEMQRTLSEQPLFSRTFVSHLLTRNARVEEDLLDQLFNSTEKRLARALLLLANFGEEGRPEPIIAKISQEMLAEMIGTTRSRVSYFMNKFRDAGFISYNGHIEVHSSLLSVVLTDPERTVIPPSDGDR